MQLIDKDAAFIWAETAFVCVCVCVCLSNDLLAYLQT